MTLNLRNPACSMLLSSLLSLASLLPGQSVAHADAPAEAALPALQPQDFAYGYELATRSAAVHDVELTAAVYAALSQAQRHDLCVFDAQAQVVPFTVFIPAELEPQLIAHKVPWFALPQDAAAAQTDLTLYVRRDEHGTIAEMRAPDPSAKPGRRGWLLDLSTLREPVLSLTPSWKQTATDFLAEIEISASDDLSRWSHVTTAPVAQLRSSERMLSSPPLTLDRLRKKYLRLTIKGNAPLDLDLTDVELSLEHAQTAASSASLVLAARPGTEPLSFLFEVPGPLPLLRGRVLFAEANTLVEGRLDASATPNGPFTERFRGPLHSVQGAEDGPGIALQDGDRFLRLTLLDKASARTAKPSLRIEYRPHHVQFLPRGKGPHLLAVGSVRRSAEPVSVLPAGAGAEQISLGARRTLGGIEMLRPAAPIQAPRPWRTYALWTVLVLTTALFAWLALRLVRDMKPH